MFNRTFQEAASSYDILGPLRIIIFNINIVPFRLRIRKILLTRLNYLRRQFIIRLFLSIYNLLRLLFIHFFE